MSPTLRDSKSVIQRKWLEAVWVRLGFRDKHLTTFAFQG